MINTNEMLATLDDAVRRLDELKVPYMVTGSFAMSTYAMARTTMDIDIVIEIGNVDANVFETKFRPDYYVDAESIRHARQHESMFNMLNLKTGVKVDCILRKSDRFELEKFKRRRQASLGGVEFWSISRNDLILSKLRWAKDSLSEMQFRDIENLLRSKGAESEITDQIREEGLADVWSAFKAWTTQAKK
jgi:hypothetical protein